MTGGLGVSKRLKLSLVFLPVIVLACLFRPAGFVSASVIPLVNCDYNSTTCSGSIGGEASCDKLSDGLCYKWSGCGTSNTITFDEPLDVSSGGYTVAMKVGGRDNYWSHINDWYSWIGSNSYGGMGRYSGEWSYGDGKDHWLFANYTNTTSNYYIGQDLWTTQGSWSIDYSTKKPTKNSWCNRNYYNWAYDTLVFDHILTENERQQLIDTGSIMLSGNNYVMYYNANPLYVEQETSVNLLAVYNICDDWNGNNTYKISVLDDDNKPSLVYSGLEKTITSCSGVVSIPFTAPNYNFFKYARFAVKENNYIVLKDDSRFGLAVYKPVEVLPDCSSIMYGPWSSCIDGFQSRSVVGYYPDPCDVSAVTPLVNRSCVDSQNSSASFDSSFDGNASVRNWLFLSGDCSPAGADSLVYLYQSQDPHLPSDDYSSSGIQLGITSDYFQSYAEPCDADGRWSRYVLLAPGVNYFTLYYRQKEFGPYTWVATDHSKTIAVYYYNDYKFKPIIPYGNDSERYDVAFRQFTQKTYADLSSGSNLNLIGYFTNGVIFPKNATYTLSEIATSSPSLSIIRQDIIEGNVDDVKKGSCDAKNGCYYAFELDKAILLNDNTSDRIADYLVKFYDIRGFLISQLIFRVDWVSDDSNPDIYWGFTLGDDWSNDNVPPPSVHDVLTAHSIDEFYLMYSRQNVCGDLPDTNNIVETLSQLPIRLCYMAYNLFMPSKDVVVKVTTGLTDVAYNSFPWNLPFVFFNVVKPLLSTSQLDKVPPNMDFQVVDIDVPISSSVYSALVTVGNASILGSASNPLTFRQFLTFVLSASAILLFAYSIMAFMGFGHDEKMGYIPGLYNKKK